MYKVIIFLVIGAVIAPPPPPPPAMAPPPSEPPLPPSLRPKPSTRTGSQLSSTSQIIRQSNDINPDGSYQWSYESDNGISAEERGEILNAPEGPVVATGNFQYKSLEGDSISLSYVADENGFQPVGSHLPVAPPIPPSIARALEWIAAHPQLDN